MQQLNKPATKAARSAQNIARQHFEQVRRDVQDVINNTAVRTKRKNPPRNKNVDCGQIQLLGFTTVA
jgi:hypothetical protein